MSEMEHTKATLTGAVVADTDDAIGQVRPAALTKLQHRLDSHFAKAADRLPQALEGDGDAVRTERTVGTERRTDTPVLPDLPSYRGAWYPVYWTPIPGSGERITVLILAKGEDGQVCVRSTIGDAILEVAFGKPKAVALRQMFDYVEKMLPDWLDAYENRAGTASGAVPVTGFTLGVAHSSCADNVQQLAAQGICLDAAFATL